MECLKDIKSFVTSKHVFCGIDVHYGYWILYIACDGEIVIDHAAPEAGKDDTDLSTNYTNY